MKICKNRLHENKGSICLVFLWGGEVLREFRFSTASVRCDVHNAIFVKYRNPNKFPI